MAKRQSSATQSPDHPWSGFNVALRTGAARLTGRSFSASPTGHFMLWLFVAGRGEVRMLDQSFNVNNDIGVLLPAGVKARARAATGRTLEVIQVPFDLNWCGELVRDGRPSINADRLTITLPGHIETSLYATMATLNLGQQILRTRARQPEDLGELDASIQILRCFYLLRQSVDQPGRGLPSSKPPMRRAYVQLLHRINQPQMRMNEIAEHVGMSSRQLLRTFHAEFGAGPIRILTRERMATARRLLLTPEFHIAEVASACGYRSSAYFCRVFKKEHDMTPGEYRSKHIEEV